MVDWSVCELADDTGDLEDVYTPKEIRLIEDNWMRLKSSKNDESKTVE